MIKLKHTKFKENNNKDTLSDTQSFRKKANISNPFSPETGK